LVKLISSSNLRISHLIFFAPTELRARFQLGFHKDLDLNIQRIDLMCIVNLNQPRGLDSRSIAAIGAALTHNVGERAAAEALDDGKA
jgi:hypothetical protein